MGDALTRVATIAAALALMVGLPVRAAARTQTGAPASAETDGPAVEAAGAAGAAGEFELLPPPAPGDWRAALCEREQAFEEYASRYAPLALADKPCPPADRPVIRVLPMGPASQADAEEMVLLERFLQAYFSSRVLVEERRLPPASVRRRPSRGFGRQLLADDILREIGRDMPADTIVRLAVTREDLFASARRGVYFNFVFGTGSSDERAAVASSARYHQHYPDEPAGVTPGKRFFKLAAHETGHVLGLAHCARYRCCMNGSNSLAESDRRPVHLCPDCLRKVEWRLALGESDRAGRYRALAEVYRELGWVEEEAFVAARAGTPQARAQGDAPASSPRVEEPP